MNRNLYSAADRSREQYNPLRGLTIARAVALLEQGQRGEFADLMWTYRFVEETDPDLLALVERRTAALCEMDYNIKRTPEDHKNFDEKLADEQAEALREAYDNIENLYEAVEHFELAAFRGFSICQPHKKTDGSIFKLECLDHWNFVRNGMYGDWYWNPDAKSTSYVGLGENAKLKPSDIMVHEVRRSVDRIGLIKFVRANLSEKDWDAFIEIYGIPGVFITLPDNVAPEQVGTYLDAAEKAAQGASGALPGGSTVTVSDGPRGNQPFELRLEWLSKKLVLAGTGGMLTMLAESGTGTLAGGAHQQTFEAIARARAAKISELFQRNIDRYVLERQFPGMPRLAYFDLAAEEEQDVGEIVKHVEQLTNAGFILDPDDVAERTGYRILGVNAKGMADGGSRMEDGEEEESAKIQNRTDGPLTVDDPEQVQRMLEKTALEAALEAESKDLLPLADRLYKLLELVESGDSEGLAEALQTLRTDLPDLAEDLLINRGALALSIEEALGAAAVNGMAESEAVRMEKQA